MRKHRGRLVGLLAALLLLAGVVDATGGRLAQPEHQGPERDTWIGYYLVWERLPGEGEEIPRNGEGWMEYGSQSVNVEGLGSVSIPQEILVGVYSRGEGFAFPGLEGYSAFLAQVEQEDGSTLLVGNQLMNGKTNVGGTKNSVSGTIYYGFPEGETAWPADGPEYAWKAYNVFQMPDGTVYLDGSGNSYGGAGGMTITGEQTETETINGEETSVTLSVEVHFEEVSRLQEVRVKEFDGSDQVVKETVFQADELEEENAVSLDDGTQWLVVEECSTGGAVTRTVYSAQEIQVTGELCHSLVALDERGMGYGRTLWLKQKTPGALTA